MIPASGTWRSLRSIMLVTLHVAAVAALIRYFAGESHPPRSLFVLVAITFVTGSLISWPISRSLFRRFDPGEADYDRTCPRCRRRDLRPLVKPGAGLFQPVSNYRCSSCWTAVRIVGESKRIEPLLPRQSTASRSGITFLDEPTSQDEIVFLDDPPKSPD